VGVNNTKNRLSTSCSSDMSHHTSGSGSLLDLSAPGHATRVKISFESWTDGQLEQKTLINELDRWEVHCASSLVVNYDDLSLDVIQKPNSLSNDKIGVGACLWDGAVILGAYLASQPRHTFIGCSAVELGAGVGMLSCLFARLGAGKVYSSDICKVLPLLEENVKVNGMADVVDVMDLEWGQHTDHLRKADDIKASLGCGYGGYPDFVIASDVTYVDNETNIQPDTIEFVRLCQRLCGKKTKVLIGLERRSGAVRDLFIDEIKKAFGTVRMIDLRKEKRFPKELIVEHIDLWELLS
jgi:predicted nicotinamide N-methyase